MTPQRARGTRRPFRATETPPLTSATCTRDPADVGLDHYATAVTAHCPYLTPAISARQVWWCRGRLPRSVTTFEVEARLFAAGYWAAERVRTRRASGDRLACDVIAVDAPASLSSRSRATLLDQPHWVLKHLYAPVGLMSGKFPPHPPSRGRHGRPLPPPPALVLALRVAIPTRDPDLLRSAPHLAETLITATDDGRSVLEAVPGLSREADLVTTWSALRDWSAQLPPPLRQPERA